MPAPLSIVIPTLNAAKELPGAVAALVPGLEAGLITELIVSDGGSQDATTSIADDAGAVVLQGPPGRGGQIARGVDAAKGAWLLILHADTRLDPDWADAVQTHINSHPEQAGHFRLRFRASGVWPVLIAQGANLRSRWLGLPYGDQGLLITRNALKDIGGVPDIPLMEDVVLARRLKGRLRPLAAIAHTSGQRYERDGWLRRATANLLLLARFSLGADPDRLARRYR